MLRSLFFTSLFLLPVLSAAQVPRVTELTRRDVFSDPPTAACHAATIEEVSPGHFLTAWFGGSYEGAKDVGIYAARGTGEEWSAPQRLVAPLVLAGDTLPCWNPVLFLSGSGRLYLFYKAGPNPREWFGGYLTSDDAGDSWSTPRYLPEGFLGPIRNKPIEVSPGVILCGSSTESVATDAWRVHLERFTEASGRWERVEVPNPREFDIIQPTFLEHGGDTLQLLCRSRHDRLVASWSTDGGHHWSPADTLGVPNSNSGVDALTLSPTSFLLVNNPLPRGADWYNGRNVLDVEYSTDGRHWTPLLDLERHADGEYSYPAIIRAADGRIHVVYTYDRKLIRHVAFALFAGE
ncbi:sialidase family protein [Lewinella sp. IMCC34183]|uniref:sialidase family protein n=1 Tax=Lewinella sp. IMCC34183 TaxID=2248762 RepID=UPI000E27D658|nr:sialidase family protein [Lewinella sp. IMCC34183]